MSNLRGKGKLPASSDSSHGGFPIEGRGAPARTVDSLGPPNALTPAPEPESTRLGKYECKEDEEAAVAGYGKGISGDDERKPSASAASVAARARYLTDAKIRKDDFAEEFPVELPTGSASSAPFTFLPYASLPSAATRDSAPNHGRKRLEHAPPGEVMSSPGLRTRMEVADSVERLPVVLATNHDVAPGAYHVPSYDSTRDFADEESKLEEEEVPSSAGVDTRAIAESDLHVVEAQRVPDGGEEGTTMIAEAQYVRMKWYQRPNIRWMLVGLVLFSCVLLGAVVALVVRPLSGTSSSSSSPPTPEPSTGASATPRPTTMVPATPEPTTVASPTPEPTTLALATPEPTTVVLATPEPTTVVPTTPEPTTVVLATPEPTAVVPATPEPTAVVLWPEPTTVVLTTPEPTTAVPATPEPTTAVPAPPEPTTVSPEQIACNFLLISDVTKCRSTTFFAGYTTGSTIPSEIGELTQLAHLSLTSDALTGTIPSEIGLLTQLTWLDFSDNSLTGTLPNEIGLLTQLMWLTVDSNNLSGTMPYSICSTGSFRMIDCYEITCPPGCCLTCCSTCG